LDATAGVANLKDNNAPQPATTPTIALSSPTSLAQDKGSNKLAAAVGTSDQRGFPFVRIFNARIDMGAFEVQPPVALNNPPIVANPIPSQVAAVGVPFVFTFGANTFSDPDNDTLTYSATLSNGGALPAWITTAPNGTTARTFAGTPGAADVGPITVRVTASDGKGGTVFTDFVLTVVASELPFTETFEAPVPPGQIAPDPRIVQKSPTFATSTTSPITGTASLQITRPTIGSRPVATVDFVSPTTTPAVKNVNLNVKVSPGDSKTIWANAIVIIDYQDAKNYKFAGLFQGRKQLSIGQVKNGVIQHLAFKPFVTLPNTTYPLNVTIDRALGKVTLTSTGGPVVSFTYAGGIATGAYGVGTLNANAKVDDLVMTA